MPPRVRPTPTGWVLSSAALLAVLLGTWARSTALLVLGQALGITLAFLAWRVSAQLRKVSVIRRHPAWAFEDEVLPVGIAVRNDGPRDLRWLEMEDRFTADRDPRKSLCLPGPVPGLGEGSLAYSAKCAKRRGAYRLGPAALALSDPLGAFEARAEARAETELTVFPRTVPISALPITGMARWDNVDTETTPKAGSSLNFSGTREYRQGDSLRFIHWGATAHTGKLIVKEFELNIATEVSIFLDAHYFAVKGMGREATFEYGVKAAASIARHALARGSRLRLVCTGKTPFETPLGTGEYQLLTILRGLTRVQADGKEPLSKILSRWLGRIEQASTVILVMNSVKMDLKAYIRDFAMLRSRQVRLIVVLVDDNTFLNLWESSQAKKVQALFIPDVVKLLVAMGVTVYTLSQGDDLTERFSKPYAYAPSAG